MTFVVDAGSSTSAVPVAPSVTAVEEIRSELQVHGIRGTIVGLGAVNSALKQMHEIATARLRTLLGTRNRAGWALEAYKQLQMWTWVHQGEDGELPLVVPTSLAPVARFGWRWLIELSLAGLENERIYLGRPTSADLSEAFTYLLLLGETAEWSDAIHYFPDTCKSVRLESSQPLLQPELDDGDRRVFDERRMYVSGRSGAHTWELQPDVELTLDDDCIRSILDKPLAKALGFSGTDLLEHFLRGVAEHPITGREIILVDTLASAAEALAAHSALTPRQACAVLDFILLSPKHLGASVRAFRTKNVVQRMSNYAGLRIPRLEHLDLIYAAEAAADPTRRHAEHIILSGSLFAEWCDTFASRVVHGQRPDLKRYPELWAACIRAEQYVQDDFVGAVEKVLAESGCVHRRSWKRIATAKERTMLPCGEIDLLAMAPNSGTLLVIECKAAVGAIDSRGYSQQLRDHFHQKKYDSKFTRKLDWVRSHVSVAVEELAKRDPRLGAVDVRDVRGLFVTKNESMARFYVEGYAFTSFVDLGNALGALLGRNPTTQG